VSEDIATMLRYSRRVYNLVFYLNADERRRDDPNWSIQYGVSAMSLIRSLIDCLYNITSIFQNPAERGAAYRRSALRFSMTFRQPDICRTARVGGMDR
jgi:hypothetical protein